MSERKAVIRLLTCRTKYSSMLWNAQHLHS